MKTLVLIFIFSLPFLSPSYSQLIEENFDYPSGDSVGAHGWISFSGGATNTVLITSPGLTFPDYAGSGIGNAATILNSGQDVYRAFSSNQTSGSIYTSMIVSVDTARASGDYFASYLPSTSTTSFAGRLYVRAASNGNISFGISKTTAGSGGIYYSDSVYSMDVSYLVVLKYTMAAGALNDSVSLFVFSGSAPSSEPAPTVGPVTGTGSDPADLGRFVLRQGSTGSSPILTVDGIISATSWDNNALPVELANFSSFVDGRNVNLKWTTVHETNNSGFEVQRTDNADKWKTIAFVEGKGTTFESNEYNFIDEKLNSGKFSYRLKQIDFNGICEYFYLKNEISIALPTDFILYQNYPNPFNPATKISFELPVKSNVSIVVFDLTGKKILEVFNGTAEPGFNSIDLNGASLSSGVYYYKISAVSGTVSFSDSKRMLLLK